MNNNGWNTYELDHSWNLIHDQYYFLWTASFRGFYNSLKPQKLKSNETHVQLSHLFVTSQSCRSVHFAETTKIVVSQY
jgi:hypothetical protein